MKINPSLEVVTGGKAADAKSADRAQAKPSAAGGATPAGGERVQLSELSTQIAALESSLAGPEIDTARVEAIKSAIREGRLTVDSGVVADRMIASALALLGKDSV